MIQAARKRGPARYRLRVAGHLDQHWSPWFGGLTLIHGEDGTTTLTGVITDQAELHGLLTKIRDLGVTLISVETLDLRRSVDDNPDSHHTHEPAGERQPVELPTLEET